MKASDIPDRRIYELVASAVYKGRPIDLSVMKAEEAMPEVPPKVVMAKVRQMIAKGRLRGCPCGCRGDLRFPWEEFGGPYSRENWEMRIAEYLKGQRVYGY